MFHFQESLRHPIGKAILLSIKPKYADLILAGSKRVEFRRIWAAQDVNMIVLYSSSPIQKIVGMVEVDKIVVASPNVLWKTCTEKGGGLTRNELRSYYTGKQQGIAVLLGKTFKFSKHVNPSEVIRNFVPPQSFRYLEMNECEIIEKMASEERLK